MTENLPATQNGGLQLAKEIPVSRAGVTPTSYAHIIALAKAAVAGGFAGKQRDEHGAAVAIAYGLECGFAPFQALQQINIIKGTPEISSEGCLSLVLQSGLLEDLSEAIEGEGDKMVATCTVTRKGMSPHTYRLTAEDMRREQLWGQGAWLKMPRHMLALRCRARALRDRFADVTGGLYTREEVEDFDTPRRPETRTLTPPGARQNSPESEPNYVARDGEDVAGTEVKEPSRDKSRATKIADAEYEVPSNAPGATPIWPEDPVNREKALEEAITETGDPEEDWAFRQKLIGRTQDVYKKLLAMGGHPEIDHEFEDVPNEELVKLRLAWEKETEKLQKRSAPKGKMSTGRK